MKGELLFKKACAIAFLLSCGNLGFAQLSGTINVGAGQTYTSLTGTGGLFEAINTQGMSADVTATITSDLTETGTVALNDFTQSGASNVHLTIVPDGPVVRNITNTGNVTTLVKFTGVSNLKIDGSFNGSGRYLRFGNSYANTTVSTILFTGTTTRGSKNDTIRNCIMEGATTSTSPTSQTGVVTLDASGTLMGANNIAFLNNMIGSPGSYNGSAVATVMAGCGIKSVTGTSASASNSNIFINSNDFVNCQWSGIVQSTATTGTASPDSFTITNNSFYFTVAPAGTTTIRYFIYVRNGQNHIVSNNYIGGSATQAGGSLLTFSSSNTGGVYGIYLAGTATNPVTVSGNTFGNIGYSGSGAINGIYTSSGALATITGNTIRNINMSSAGIVYGINVNSNNAKILNNTIGGSYATDKLFTGGTTTVGIYVVGNSDTISGNVIRNMISTGANSSSGTDAIGIYVKGVSPFVYNNTIDSIIGNNPQNSGGQAVMGINMNTQTTGSFNIAKNTITNIINTNTTGTGYSSAVFGIGIINVSSTATIGGRLDGNFISNVYGMNSTGGNNICGILENNNATGGNDTFINNVIIFDTVGVPNAWLKAFHSANGAVTSTFINNTFYISGNITLNAALSSNKGGASCISRLNGNPNLTLYNNIFINKATNENTGTLATIRLMANSTGVINSNYNLFYTNSSAGVFDSVGTLKSLNEWRASFAADTFSMVGTASFVSNKDMHIVTSDPLAWNVYGSGLALQNNLAVPVDIDGNARSTTMGIPTTIGAYEIAMPTVAPATMTMIPATPVIGTPTVFFSNGRKIAEINWDAAATLPSSINATFYPGVPAPGSPNSSNVNSYMDIQQTGFAGNYTIKLYTNDAERNGIAFTGMGAIKKHDGDANYTVIANAGSNNADAAGNYILSNTLSNFSIFGLTNPSTPLPITWNKVNAMLNHWQQADITWNVSEKEVRNYTIQKSTDGVKFNDIATVSSKGNGVNSYSYTEAAKLNGKAWYRIAQKSVNGTVDYSIVMMLQNSAAYGKINIYPNPATQVLNVEMEQSGASYGIYNLQGKAVMKGSLLQGKNMLNVSGLAKGFYTIKIGETNQKVVIQ